MFEFLKDLLLHSSFIIFLGFTYSFLFIQRKKFHQKEIFIALIFVTLFLTMIFPVRFTNGLVFDMKLIPFIISYFYLGTLPGILVIIFMVGFEFITEVHKILPLLINYMIMLLVLKLIKKQFINGSILKKILWGLFVYLLITLTRFGALQHSNNQDQFPYLVLFSLVSFLALAATFYIIEMSNFYIKTIDELHKAEKFSAVSQLAASVAHEIRNPMTTIKGFMQVLKSDKNLTTKQHTFIKISLDELERTQVIINNFLSFAKPNIKQEIFIDVTNTIEEIAEFMRPYASLSNICIQLNIQENLFFRGNPHELRQVFINISKNGIESMKSGGNFEITATRIGKNIRVDFKDDGIGMNQKQINRLGQPYYSTKEKGTGLGMMISFDIIKKMKGDIQVKSQEGIGTTFTILIPYQT